MSSANTFSSFVTSVMLSSPETGSLDSKYRLRMCRLLLASLTLGGGDGIGESSISLVSSFSESPPPLCTSATISCSDSSGVVTTSVSYHLKVLHLQSLVGPEAGFHSLLQRQVEVPATSSQCASCCLNPQFETIFDCLWRYVIQRIK